MKRQKIAREARDPAAKKYHLILPAELSWWFPDASTIHQSPGQRSQLTFPVSQSGKLPVLAATCPGGSLVHPELW